MIALGHIGVKYEHYAFDSILQIQTTLLGPLRNFPSDLEKPPMSSLEILFENFGIIFLYKELLDGNDT